MQLFETKLMLVSETWSVRVEVPSTNITDMLRAVFLSDQTSDYGTIHMFLDSDYVVDEKQCISSEVREILDIIGTDNKITAIRLIRKISGCSLLDAKNAVEGYSK